MNAVLRIDLTTGDSTVNSAVAADKHPFGLVGLNVLIAETRPRLPVYHPDQLIVFDVGSTAGRRVLALTRFAIFAKSPQSGGIAESRVEGPLGPALRDTGFNTLVLTGRAARPCYILIAGRQVQVVIADELWGLDTFEVTDRLRARHGRDAHVAAIGPAGENLVRFANLITDRGFAAARMGAVFGAKRCKAVVIIGGAEHGIADAATIERITANYRSRITANPLTRSQFEPPGFGAWVVEGLEGYLGVRNFSTSKAKFAGSQLTNTENG